jgi:chaperone BCS1
MTSEQSGSFAAGGLLQTMGIINALKTGDVMVDMAIAMLIPFVLRCLFGLVERFDQILPSWKTWWACRHHKHQRYIVYKSTRNYWGGCTALDSDTQNTVLIKAIKLYLHQKMNLNLKVALLDLTSLDDKNCNQQYGSYYNDDDDDNDDEEHRRSRKTLVGMLSKYKIVKAPPHHVWHKLGNHGASNSPVELMINQQEESEGKEGQVKSQTTLTFHFVSPGADAIDSFIDKAYQWYMSELRKLEDNSRYMYDLQDTSSTSGDSENGTPAGAPLYARYKLSDEKTFESLFFRQKETLLKLVDHFQNKTGKYSISGYPHKLGILLHGPPGTGKTSLIKALAQYTGRSIVNVSLSKISTNSELMSVFFDKRYHIQGEAVPVRLGMKDVIFVMEDIDAASKVVKRRDGKKGNDVEQYEYADVLDPKSLWRMMLESNDSDCRALVGSLIDKNDRLKEEARKPEVLLGLSEKMGILPGLGLVGADCDVLAKIGETAIDSANTLMNQYSTVDQFLGVHARAINALVESGAEIDDDFVDKLLGKPNQPTSLTPPRSGIDRQESYTNTSDRHIGQDTAELSEKAFMSHGPEAKPGTKTDAAVGSSLFKKKDQLNLSGLLNVLDGVIDSPGRIVIMTSNHPDQLDPALIRPGRIDKKLMLGFMTAPDVVDMLEHYFQVTLTDNQSKRVTKAIEGCPNEGTAQLNLTPAQIEQLTAEHEDIEDMIAHLEEKGALKRSKFHRPGMTSKSPLRY